MVEELEELAAARPLEGGHEAFQGIEYLRVHGESGHLPYLKCKRRGITRGSGAIESTIRRVINLRMKGKGIFWNEESAEAVMLMRANLLSEQWESEIARTRKQWQSGRCQRYRWKAEDIFESVKLADEEEGELLKMPQTLDDQSHAA